MDNFSEAIGEINSVLSPKEQKELMVAIADGFDEWGVTTSLESRLAAIRILYPFLVLIADDSVPDGALEDSIQTQFLVLLKSLRF